MSKVNGVVSFVHEAEFQGKPSYSIKLNGDENWYRLGANRFAGVIEKGAQVELTYDEKTSKTGSVRLAVTAAKRIESEAPKGASTSAAPAARSAGGYNDPARQDAISYQSARNAALDAVKLLVVVDGIKFTAKSDKKAILDALVDEYTVLYFRDVESKGAVARVAATEEEPLPGAAKQPAEYSDDE